MKKIIISMIVLAASLNLAAQTVLSQATFTLKGNTSNESGYAVIALVSDADADSYCASLYEGSFSDATVATYVEKGSSKYQIYATNNAEDLKDLALKFKVGDDTEYTLTASGVQGSDIKIGGIAVDNSFSLTLHKNAAGTGMEEEVVINPSATQTEFVCQVPAGLSFHGDQDYTGLQVLDENDNVIEAAFDLAAGEDKVVAIATAGRYYVLNGTQKIFFVVR